MKRRAGLSGASVRGCGQISVGACKMKQRSFQRSILCAAAATALMALTSCAPQQATEVASAAAATRDRSTHVLRYPAIINSNEANSIGDLWLGHTTLEEALDIFPKTPPGSAEHTGAPRPGQGPAFITYDGKNLAEHPQTVYNPWGSMYQLWFDRQQHLKVIVDAAPPEYRQPANVLAEKYPGLHRVTSPDNAGPVYVMQARVNPCVVLPAWISDGDQRVTGTAFAYHCD